MKKTQKIDFSSPEAFAASVENMRNKYFSHKVCEAKDHISACTGSIIRAHSVSRKFLKMIADGKGQVYHFDDRLYGLIDRGGKADVSKIGYGQASTYQMFCGMHDQQLFMSIENNNELIPDEQQCLLLMYRALMMEKYLKESQCEYYKILTQHKNDYSEYDITNVFLQQFDCMYQGSLMGLYDLDRINADMAPDVKNNNFSKLRALRIYFRKKPGFLCSGAFHVMSDYNGTPLTSLQSEQPISDILSVNILPLGGKNADNGVAVLSWLYIGQNSDSQKLIDSIRGIPVEKISNVLIHFVFEYVDNIYISPSWWNSCSQEVKSEICKLHQVCLQPPTDWHQITTQYDNWHITHAELWNGKQWEDFSFVDTKNASEDK